ncbi:MAG: 50S ribosomal protein L28, partial [bacterium]
LLVIFRFPFGVILRDVIRIFAFVRGVWYSCFCISCSGERKMARVCEMCDKKTMSGQNTQHRRGGGWFNKAPRTKTKFAVNLQEKRLVIDGKLQKIKICTRCLRNLDKQVA